MAAVSNAIKTQDVDLSLRVVAAAVDASNRVAIARMGLPQHHDWGAGTPAGARGVGHYATTVPNDPICILPPPQHHPIRLHHNRGLWWQWSEFVWNTVLAALLAGDYQVYNELKDDNDQCNPLRLDQMSKSPKKSSKSKRVISFSSTAVCALASTSSCILLTLPYWRCRRWCPHWCVLYCHAPCCCAVHPVTPAAAIPYHCIAWPWWQPLQRANEDVNIGVEVIWHQQLHLPSFNIECGM